MRHQFIEHRQGTVLCRAKNPPRGPSGMTPASAMIASLPSIALRTAVTAEIGCGVANGRLFGRS